MFERSEQLCDYYDVSIYTIYKEIKLMKLNWHCAYDVNGEGCYLVPLNEYIYGKIVCKELRVSTLCYSPTEFGPMSGAKINGYPIEQYYFENQKEATEAREKYAMWLCP